MVTNVHAAWIKDAWYVCVCETDDQGIEHVVADSRKPRFPVDVDLYSEQQFGYLRDRLEEAYPDAEIVRD